MDNVDVPVAEDPLAGVPELTSYLATDEEERIEALKLVADSVAQQRQLANKALLYSPMNLAIAVGILVYMARYMDNNHYDKFVIASSCLGLIMTFMAGTRLATKDYLSAAEEINWEWVGDSDLLITKFGDEVIGTALIEWVSGESRQKRKKAWRGFIKAWTVRRKYRNKGVGTALLEDAIKEAKKKGAEGLEFDDLHASMLYTMMNIPLVDDAVADLFSIQIRNECFRISITAVSTNAIAWLENFSRISDKPARAGRGSRWVLTIDQRCLWERGRS